jgi:glyoxylase-like metal-dependent hydrolase (beta-lactamase superfamily II)
VSRRELDYARVSHPEDAYLPRGILEELRRHRVTALDGATELGPGLTALPAPGHTPGLYALALETTERGRVVLASDAIKYPKEVMTGVGDLVLDTIEASRASIAAILAQADRIVPGHFVEMRKADGAWTWDQPAPFDLRLR